jgi:hypothetical protein
VQRVVASQAHIPDFLPELVAQLKQVIEGDVSIEIHARYQRGKPLN